MLLEKQTEFPRSNPSRVACRPQPHYSECSNVPMKTMTLQHTWVKCFKHYTQKPFWKIKTWFHIKYNHNYFNLARNIVLKKLFQGFDKRYIAGRYSKTFCKKIAWKCLIHSSYTLLFYKILYPFTYLSINNSLDLNWPSEEIICFTLNFYFALCKFDRTLNESNVLLEVTQ